MKRGMNMLLAIACLALSAEEQQLRWPWAPNPRVQKAIPLPKLRTTPVSPAPVPTPKVLVALPNYDTETATRLQIFLDNNDFGPGKIDGRMGEFFRKALISYKHAHAMPKTGAVDSWLLDSGAGDLHVERC